MLNFIHNILVDSQRALFRVSVMTANDWIWCESIERWNAETIAFEYNVSEYHSEVLSRYYDDRCDFESSLRCHQNEFNVDRLSAIKTLTGWAVDDENTCDLDQIIWDENNRLTGANC